MHLEIVCKEKPLWRFRVYLICV